MYPTHLIYRALDYPQVETEPCTGICAFCGTELSEGVLLKETISDAFTNYDLLSDRSASHVCKCCHAVIREPALRKMNFIATAEQGLTLFKRDTLEKYLFGEIPAPPFVMCVQDYNEKFQVKMVHKHSSFRSRVNHSQKLFYIQKEDEQILFSPAKYTEIYEAMKRLYRSFSKSSIQTGEYQQKFIKKYGLREFMRDEAIIKYERGTHQFDLLIYAINMDAEQLKKVKERKAKKGE